MAPAPPKSAAAHTIGKTPYAVTLCESSLIGRGSYGSVYKGTRGVSGFQFDIAIKIVAYDDLSRGGNKQKAFVLERTAFERLGKGQLTPSLVTCYDAVVASYPCTPFSAGYLFMELLARTTLKNEIAARYASGRPCGVGETFFLMDQIVRAVYVLHAHGIAHRDIKADNISYDPATQRCVLFDLGLSVCTPVPRDYTQGGTNVFRVSDFVGSPLYMAPEVLGTSISDAPYSPFPADIWAIGHVLFEIVTSKALFDDVKTMETLRHRIHRVRPNPTAHLEVPQYCAFLDATLHYKCEERATASELQRYTADVTRRFAWPPLVTNTDTMDSSDDLHSSSNSSSSESNSVYFM